MIADRDTRNSKPTVYKPVPKGWKRCKNCGEQKMLCSFTDFKHEEHSTCNVCLFLKNVHPGNGTHYTNNKVYLKYGIAINGVSPQPKNTMARMQAAVT
jgi:hypothetical protein